MLTQNKLKEILDYDPQTGKFKWKSPKSNRVKIGDEAGGITPRGYIYIKINGKPYLAHRLAWLYVYGEWPKNQIDHINGIRDDNRITNLRNVTHRENSQNRIEHRGGNLLGCNFHKPAKKWRAQIQINGKVIHLGLYNTEMEAHNAYIQKIKQLRENTHE